MELFATAAKGTEGALRDELREIRVRGVRADRGGVHFSGDLLDGGRVCLHSRIAVRVLGKLGEFDAPDGEALYDGVRSVDFGPWISPKHTLAVSAVTKNSRLTHTQYISQHTKDAVVDQIRDAVGSRPSVDRDDADVRIFVHVVRDRATLYLDLSGESLHRRGYRTRIGEAPLKETLAAACLRLAGWDRERPLVDPMCGSGTIAIEAALWSRDIAPGILRPRFGFERWASHDETLAGRMRDARDAARARVRSSGPEIFATDIDPEALLIAEENAKGAGVSVQFRRQPVRAVASTSPAGLVITNPPYGERLQATDALYRDMATAFRELHGHHVAVLSGTPSLEDAMKIRPRQWWALWNGAIECRLLLYEIR